MFSIKRKIKKLNVVCVKWILALFLGTPYPLIFAVFKPRKNGAKMVIFQIGRIGWGLAFCWRWREDGLFRFVFISRTRCRIPSWRVGRVECETHATWKEWPHSPIRIVPLTMRKESFPEGIGLRIFIWEIRMEVPFLTLPFSKQKGRIHYRFTPTEKLVAQLLLGLLIMFSKIVLMTSAALSLDWWF